MAKNDGSIGLFGDLKRDGAPLTFNKPSGGDNIAEFGTLGGSGFTGVGRVDVNGQATFDGDIVLPVDSSVPGGGIGNPGDIRLYSNGGTYRFYFKGTSAWQYRNLT